MRTTFYLLSLFLSFILCKTVSYDVHIKIPDSVVKEIKSISKRITNLCPNNEIDFDKVIPHITLYLTEFEEDNVKNLTDTVTKFLSLMPQFQITLGSPYISSEYLMWNVTKSIDLQTLSDLTITISKDYIASNQTVPDWVYNLPEEHKKLKILYIHCFGSPCVFNEFDPHITMGWDAIDDMQVVLDKITFPSITFTAKQVGIGLVSDHGSVLKDSDIALIKLRATKK